MAVKAALCVQSEAELGTSLTSAFGRLDGTVLAVVGPADTECFLPNDDHVVLQVLWNGEAYRMVISVLSTYGDPDVAYLLAPTAPAGLVWQEGWHTGVGLDYVTDLGLHAGDFDGFPSSAHLIHRNGNGQDGAVVLDPESATPRVMAFHFANQTF
ncbi:MAG: hypothetical protein HY908_12880 [Myxococcales bacterium]|nr:hypothetical protein [Myxococcales bacterium]